MDQIEGFAISPGSVAISTVHGHVFSIVPDTDIVVSYIGFAKKISEQNGVPVILDLTGSVPKIEKLGLPQK
ncbi:hypothetical protein [Methanomethylovorans sp.]|uniref:hypothetical protein n=1 Tax=Methanomethylovorans sp. TaxID=2758717 RepID=UPI00351C2543